MDREPCVAGRFYPAEPARLRADVEALLGGPAPPGRAAAGILSPHAGYVFSGKVAGATWARVAVPRRVLLLCPNHTGLGARVSLWPDGAWRTPLGALPVDEDMARDLLASGEVEADREAHRREHALEVQLPFLQALRHDAAIAALCLGPLPLSRCRALGRAVAATARAHGALLVASSDMSHYVPAEVARRKDRMALERVEALDDRGLHEVVEREDISMCGYVPATVLLAAARELGATSGAVVLYRTSGDVTGDDSSVVGYAGAVIA